MTTKRALSHKGLVNFEKKRHHWTGIRLSEHSKIRWRNLADAVQAESADEWNNRKTYSELAQELYELGPVSINLSENPEFAKKLWEALTDD